MNLREYETTGRQVYEDFCLVVRNLLTHAIKSEGGYRLQQIQHRTKTVESLAARLEEMNETESEEIETLRKDIAGCRIIFYTNNDVNRFINSGIVRELFEIDWERTKVHHPRLGEQDTTSLFQSYNYVVSLKPDRAALLEYAHFEGFWCEVQVQTILNHAWAEMAHDTIYKRPNVKGFGERELKEIKGRLDEVMRQHLLQAGFIFQKIDSDIERLIEGQALFDKGAVDAVLNAADNNERLDAAKRLLDYVLPNYDDVASEYPGISETLKESWIVADQTENKTIETPFGWTEGTRSYYVTDVLSDIFSRYRYLNPVATFELIRDLYVQTRNKESLEQLVELAGRLSSHTTEVWEKYGPVVQIELVEALKKDKGFTLIEPIAIRILEEILKPDITGTTVGASTVTIHRGTLVYSEALAKARSDAIALLAHLARTPNNEMNRRDRKSAFSALFTATRMPQHQEADPKLTAMILTDSAATITALQSIALDQPFEIRQDLENKIFKVWRWNRILSNAQSGIHEVAVAHERFTSSVYDFCNALNSDEEFVIFKVLVGHQSVFPHMWEEENSDRRKNKDIRNKEQDKLINGIDQSNWEIWKRRLTQAGSVKSNDMATFPPLIRFLEQLAIHRPDFALNLLCDRDMMPRWSARHIANALWKAGVRNDVVSILKGWIIEGRYVTEVATALVSMDRADRELIEKTTEKAIELKDVEACVDLMDASVRNFSENEPLWREQVFLRCLNTLTTLNNYSWVDRIRYSQEDSLFESLSEDQSRVLLEAIVGLPSIDFEVERILKVIAKRFHKVVLEWFRARIVMSNDTSNSNYSPLPFAFHELGETLRPYATDILLELRSWHEDPEVSDFWQASRLISQIYPDFDIPLPETLEELVRNGDNDTLIFLTSVLGGFNGQDSFVSFLKELLRSPSATDEIENALEPLVNETGVMTGNFGPAQTYQKKIELLTSWLDDDVERVSKFAEKQIQYFEQCVASETRRAQEEVALRRLDFGEDITDDIGGPKQRSE